MSFRTVYQDMIMPLNNNKLRKVNTVVMDGPYDIIEEKKITEAGDTILKRYQKGKFLGKGGFAKCYEIKDTDTGRAMAAKIIDKSTLSKGRAKQKLLSEIKIHKAMNHPHVVKFDGYFEDSQRAYILLELCPNQTLKEMVKKRKKLHELEAQFYMSQLVSGVKYIHTLNVIHRDLKLGNLFIGKSLELKIGDFGLAAKLDFAGERRRTVCGTPNYIAPEVLNSKVCGHSFEADVWSIGVILYAMLVGKPPFETSNVKTTYRKIKANDYIIPADAGLSSEAKALIEEILVANPSNRPTLDTIMRHQFMTKNYIPKQLPITSLTFPLSCDFINQYIKSDKNDSSKLLSSTTTAASTKKMITESASKEITHTKDLLNQGQTQSQKTLDIRAVTASKPSTQAVVGSTKAFLKTNNYITSLQRPAFQPQPKSTIKPVVLATKKSNTNIKIMSGTCARPLQGSTPSIQNSMLTSNNTTSNFNTVGSGARVVPSSAVPTIRPTEVGIDYVMYYQDYTDKYGIGYILTTGVSGFYYNDMTNLLWLDYRSQYAYSDFYSKGEKAAMLYVSESACSKELEKKVKILTHFRNWCQKIKEEGKAHFPATSLPVATATGEVALKRIIKTKNGILLRLSNNVVQMIFLDQSQIILCFKSKVLIYISKKGVKQSMKITNELLVTAGEKVVKRFKYTLNMLNYLNSNKGLALSQRVKPTHDRRAPQII